MSKQLPEKSGENLNESVDGIKVSPSKPTKPRE